MSSFHKVLLSSGNVTPYSVRNYLIMRTNGLSESKHFCHRSFSASSFNSSNFILFSDTSIILSKLFLLLKGISLYTYRQWRLSLTVFQLAFFAAISPFLHIRRSNSMQLILFFFPVGIGHKQPIINRQFRHSKIMNKKTEITTNDREYDYEAQARRECN